MNKKMIGVIIGVLILFVIIFGGNIMNGAEDYETAYYIEANSNFICKCGLLLSDCCYYAVDIVISGISSLFGLFLG